MKVEKEIRDNLELSKKLNSEISKEKEEFCDELKSFFYGVNITLRWVLGEW